MKRLFSTITFILFASLAMAQAPIVNRKKSQDQPTSIPNKPVQQKLATPPSTPKRPTTGVLNITSTPSDASVKLDNDYLGTTPITIRQQRPGTYTITFSAEGYETRSKTVVVTAGETTTCSATLVKKGQAAPTTPTTPTTTTSTTPSFEGMTPSEIGKKGRELYDNDDFSGALPYVYEAAKQGYLDSEYIMGLMSYYGDGVVKDYEQAAYWFRKAADSGGIYSMNMLGTCYEYGRGVKQSWTDAVYWYRKSAEDDCGRAQDNLGLCYENGTGVSQDWTEAVKWYRKAADNDVSSGQMHLGYCYYNGYGIAQDYDKAVYWYRKAADKGNSAAMNNLGVCYARGNGVTQDYVESAAWYRKAADSGNATAQNNLGDCYYDGKGVTKDYEQAVYWYRKAFANGNRNAHYNLGWCYYFGQGVTEDKQEAYRLMKLASDQGHESAKKFIDEHSFTASASGQQPVRQSSVSSGLPATITVEYLINHPLCYFNSWDIDITFQQAYSQISREHPEWVLDNYQQKDEHLWIDGGLNIYYLGVKIKRYVAYWYGTKKLVSHAFYLKDMTASKSDEVLAVILKELSKLGYSMSRSKGTYTTDYVGTVGGMEVKVEQWNEHGKDIEISVNYRSLKKQEITISFKKNPALTIKAGAGLLYWASSTMNISAIPLGTHRAGSP